MADITQIQVGSTTYDIRDGKHTIFIVKGTQAASTNLFTGNLPDIDELYEGLMIQYWLPFAGTSSNATLELTLKNNVSSGAIPVYAGGTTRLTTHQPAQTYAIYIYQTVIISGTSYTGWWQQRAYYTNTTYTYFNSLNHNKGYYKADSPIYRYQMIFHVTRDLITPLNNVSNSTGTAKAMLTEVEFDPFDEIYFYNSTTTRAKDAEFSADLAYSFGEMDLRYSFNCGNTAFTANKDLYLQVLMQSNGKCKIANTMPLTQTLPTTNDGIHYIFLGRVSDTVYKMSLYPHHPIYYHDGINLRKLDNIDLATQSNPGLMSASDKAKLDGLDGDDYAPASHTHGNITNAGAITSDTAVASGDKIVVADSSDSSKLIRTGINFDGSTTTTALTPKGTWESFAKLGSPAFTGTPTAPTAADGTNSTQIATTAFVQSAFKANDAMIFKGTIGSSGATVSTLPATHYKGWTYKVATSGTYAGQSCEIGDTIICVTDGTSANDAHWTVIQANIDGAVTGPASAADAHVATFSGTSGKVIKDSGFTIGKSVPSDAKFTDTTYSNGDGISLSGTTFSAAFPTSGTPAALGTANNGTSNNVARADHVHAKPTYSKSDVGLGNVTNDAQIAKSIGTAKGDIIYFSGSGDPERLAIGSNGQVLKVSSSGIPEWSSDTDTDTKVTNTLATTTKYYVTGTTTATTNTGTQSFDSGIYATTTAGQLNAGSYKVNEQVTLQWNATDESLDFVFA